MIEEENQSLRSMSPNTFAVKKRLMILIDWFTPGYLAGGPIQSCRNICKVIGRSYDIYILTTDTDHGKKEPYADISTDTWMWNEALSCHIRYLKKATLNSKKILGEMKSIKPDFIYLNHLFSPYFVIAPLLYRILKKSRATWVVCPRGALFPSALNHKRLKKLPVMWFYKYLGLASKVIFHATTVEEARVTEQHFPDSTIRIAGNIPDIDQVAFIPVKKNANELRCVFIARIVPIKNLSFLLEVLAKIDKKYTVSLNIIGPKEDKDYWQSCSDLISQLPSHIHVADHGPLPAEHLSDHLFQSHLYVLPTQGENFGHSILNALLHGRPILISDRTPWRNLTSRSAGWDLPLAEPSAYVSVLESIAAAQQDEYDLLTHGAWKMAQEYIQSSNWKTEYQSLFA